MDTFDRDILRLAESLFPPGEVDTLTQRGPAVRVVHRRTSVVVEQAAYATQIRNKAAALLLLRHRVDVPPV